MNHRNDNQPRHPWLPADGVDGMPGTAKLEPDLLASWERSMQYGLRRQDHALFSHEVTNALAKRVVDENQRLLTHASPEMVRLYSGLGSARWVALCVNRSGEVVCSVGDRAGAPRQIRAVMHPGRRLIEAELGTTAPGCVLAAGKPIVVSHGEHFLYELENFYCACAPIHGGDGQLAGAVDITGVDVSSVPLASEMVGVAARVIENNLLADIREGVLLRFHCDDRLLGTPYEGILAITRDGRVSGVNRAARQLLGLAPTAASPGDLEAMFDGSFESLLDRARRGGGHARVRTRAGALAFLRAAFRRPEPKPGRGARAQHDKAGDRRPGGRVFVLNDRTLRAGFEQAVSMFRHGLPTLLEGETGTGKELFARALHESARPEGPFVALNCAAIPESLIESELFGYVDGAFTGGRKGGAAGRIEQADRGVLFLDEIGDMPLAMQSRLLRVLQERVVTRIGGSAEIPVDMLVLSATHRPLADMARRREFREDLYYRLNGFTLRLPALRERSDRVDIAAELLLHFDAAQGAGPRRRALDEIILPAALARLAAYPWPGNVRQLEQTIRGLLALRDSDAPIDLTQLPEWLQADDACTDDPRHTRSNDGSRLDAAQDALVRKVLREHGGNVSAAARALGVSRTTIYSRLKRGEQGGCE